MRQQHHHHQLDQKSVRGATSLTFAEKSDPSSDTMNKIPTKAKSKNNVYPFCHCKMSHLWNFDMQTWELIIVCSILAFDHSEWRCFLKNWNWFKQSTCYLFHGIRTCFNLNTIFAVNLSAALLFFRKCWWICWRDSQFQKALSGVITHFAATPLCFFDCLFDTIGILASKVLQFC